MTSLGQKLVRALRDAPATIRKYVLCDHEFKFIGKRADPNGLLYEQHKCDKCGCTRVLKNRNNYR